MASTTFTAGTVVASSWLNDVNTKTYKEYINIKQSVFGAAGNGTTDDTLAFNNALAVGGTIYIPTGTYKITDRLLVTVNNTVLVLGENVTLNLSGWVYSGTQIPFGNQIHITANNCSILGSGYSSLIQLTGGTKANGIGILHKSGLVLKDFVLDGGKASVTAIADDTFSSAISIVCDTGSGATLDANVSVHNVICKNFIQYGLNVYGNKANNIIIDGCWFYNMGDSGQALSVGAGLVITKECSNIKINNCFIYSNKYHGVFCSSAGKNGSRYSVTNNTIYSNGGSGVAFVEQPNYGSIAGQGLDSIVVSDNICNGNTGHGILFGTYTNVGFLKYITCVGNTANNNTGYGILGQSNIAPNMVSYVNATGNTTVGNGSGGVSFDSNVSNYNMGSNINNGVGDIYSGTFTPSLIGTTTAGTCTYVSRAGSFTKVNDRVFIDCLIDYNTHTGTGNFRLTGLPFTSSAVEPQTPIFIEGINLVYTGQALLFVAGGQTYADFSQINNGTVSSVAVDASATIRFQGSYRVA